MTKLNFLTLLVCVVFLNACSTMKISVDYDNEASFANLKTFNWLPGMPLSSGDPKVDSNNLMHERIRSEIETWLTSNDHKKTVREQADFLVSYYVVIEQKTRITVLNDYYGYPRGWRYYDSYDYPYSNRTYVYEYEQGTLIIDIINNKTHELMWRGTAEDEVSDLKTPEEKKARIAEVVKNILQKFPPQIL